MKKRWITGPRLLMALFAIVLAAVAFFMLRSPAVEVEIAEARRGALVVTIDDLGETRVRDLYVVSAPVTGQLLRVGLKPGDRVVPRSTVLARLQPLRPDPLDARSYAQASASVQSAEARLAAARARVTEARAAEVLAARDQGRVAELARRGFVSRARLDEAQATLQARRAALVETRQAADSAAHEVEAARALLMQSSGPPVQRTVTVTSPVPGFVMTVPQESERVVAAGTALVQVGDPDKLEIVTDLLSDDAVRVSPGARVLIEDWGGDRPLEGRVRLVEPFGFTKISALGVEEQRVNVVIDLVEPHQLWARLGHGYRVTVRVVTSAEADAIKVPISALVRDGEGWSVFVVDSSGKAQRRTVVLGPMNDEEASVRRGLSAGETVVNHPSDRVTEGTRVRRRAA